MNRWTGLVALMTVAMATAADTRANQITFCPGTVAYYVVPSLTPSSSTLREYFDGVTLFAAPPVDPSDHWRTVDETRTEILSGVCIDESAAFEASHGVDPSRTRVLDGELFALFDFAGRPLAVKWVDSIDPIAQGGGITVQGFFVCDAAAILDGGPRAVVSNVSAAHSGLDRDALSASELNKEKYWFRPLRRLLRLSHARHIATEWGERICSERLAAVDKSAFVVAATDGGTSKPDYRVHYDNVDPGFAENGTPSP